jgi:hypothetical protein
MLLAALAFVGAYGSNVPSWDDWDLVPALTGEQPVTAAWLWSQHNEHRIPLPRLLLLGLNRLAGCDFRVAMFFNVSALGALAFGMILAAKRVRGRVGYADAFFPLALLHWGHGANFLWASPIQYVLSTALASVVLLAVVTAGTRFRPGAAVVTGVCLVLLPLCGGNGVALVPAPALWLACSAALHCRSREAHARRDGLLALGLAASALLLVALYFLGYERAPNQPFTPSLRAALTNGVAFFTQGFGPAARALWPFSGLGVLGLLLASAAALAAAGRGRPREWRRASGLLSFLGALACLALAVGLGRSGLEARYVTLAVPALCWAYFVWALYGTPAVRRYVLPSFFALTCIALGPNTRFGIDYGTDLRSHLGSFERDMEAGTPGYRLIRRHAGYLHPHQEILTDYLPMLRRAGVGRFRLLREDPPFREVALPLESDALNEVTWKDGAAYATGNYPYVVFALREDTYVCGIRLRYSYSSPEGTLPCVSICWKRGGESDFTNGWSHSPTGDRGSWERGTWARRAAPETTMTVWVCDTAKQFRVHPDYRPCVFRISEIVLLLPPAGGQAP